MNAKPTILLLVALVAAVSCVAQDQPTRPPSKTPSLETQVKEFESKYGVKLVRKGYKFTAADDKTTGQDSDKVDVYLPLFLAEFNLYPPAAIKRSGIKQIVFCKKLAYDGQLRAAIPGFEQNVMYYDVERGSYDKMYQRASIHHEFYHHIDYKDDGKVYVDNQWARLNTKDFKYGRGGIHVQNDPTQGVKFDRPGFLNKYSTQGVEEDKAEIFAYLVTEAAMMNKRIATDSVVAAKVKMMKQLMRSFSKSVDEEFWEKAAMVKRPKAPAPIRWKSK